MNALFSKQKQESDSRIFEVPAGMPASVFRDKYARHKGGAGGLASASGPVPTDYETWADVAMRTVDGNFSLTHDDMDRCRKTTAYKETLALAVAGVMPFSGRHLQHGDLDQRNKVGELYTNCATALFSWASFLLLMKGSGVGRDYSSGLCFVDWDYLPNCRFILDAPDKDGKGGHADYQDWIESTEDALHKYDAESESVRWFEVEDSAEGWAKVLMIMETAAFHKNNRDNIFIFDFSKVRPAGSPLRGQQNRPASGPIPFIRALHRVMSIKGAEMKPWKQALFIDHYMAACVVVGGVRRSARIACKYYRDRDVIEFIDIKRGGHLWSANNSILVDRDFWVTAESPKPSHERRVFEAAIASSYWDDTGEPGFINADMLNQYTTNLDAINEDTYISDDFAKRFGGIHPQTKKMIGYHLAKAKALKYKYIVNPCGEIVLAVFGGYCCIADIALSNAVSTDEALTAAKRTAEFLVRVNTMSTMYKAEVNRTNRIGVSLTGIHEFAWRVFNLTFRDLIDESKSKKFWRLIADMRDAVEHAADSESRKLGLSPPATYTCIKPSGTISKVLACTEGAHLPAHRHYLRWTMASLNGEVHLDHAKRGYPVKDVSHQYANTVVIGFPTCLAVVDEMPTIDLVTASEATVDEQYAWLHLLERYWLGEERQNNQVSFTLKWRKNTTSYEQYADMVLKNQPTVRCCSLMPDIEQSESAYAYIPEEPISKERYDEIVASIKSPDVFEVYDGVQLECEGGACPIESDIHEKSLGVN